ncbi:MAG: hypothetical protein OIF38_04035, partial [Cellvibrionaceae bacterium]|nr:hypothetical protein [Cellvibrionaceae bacterium]
MIKNYKAYWLAALAAAAISVNAGAETAKQSKVDFSADDFECLQQMTPVRGFFVDNLLGQLDAT